MVCLMSEKKVSNSLVTIWHVRLTKFVGGGWDVGQGRLCCWGWGFEHVTRYLLKISSQLLIDHDSNYQEKDVFKSWVTCNFHWSCIFKRTTTCKSIFVSSTFGLEISRQWRNFPFFNDVPVKDVHDLDSSPEIFKVCLCLLGMYNLLANYLNDRPRLKFPQWYHLLLVYWLPIFTAVYTFSTEISNQSTAG